MIGGVNNLNQSLAKVYSNNNNALAEVMGRIASGKKIQKPSDDFSGYVRASNLENDISKYERIKQSLQAAKADTSKAVEVGTAVYEDLKNLKTIASDYYASSDDDEKSALEAEFKALQKSITQTIDNNDDVYITGAVQTIDVDAGTAVQNFAIDFYSQGTLADAEATAIKLPSASTASTSANLTAIQGEIDKAVEFLVGAERMDKAVDRQVNFTDTIIESKKSVISSITDINDAEEIAKQTDKSIRQQAVVSMMSQANLSQQGILQLYM
ncbi:MAG: flagellin [Chitinispirillaceae bacterium]